MMSKDRCVSEAEVTHGYDNSTQLVKYLQQNTGSQHARALSRDDWVHRKTYTSNLAWLVFTHKSITCDLHTLVHTLRSNDIKCFI